MLLIKPVIDSIVDAVHFAVDLAVEAVNLDIDVVASLIVHPAVDAVDYIPANGSLFSYSLFMSAFMCTHHIALNVLCPFTHCVRIYMLS